MPETNQPENATQPADAGISTRYGAKPQEVAAINAAFGYNPSPTVDQLERMSVVRAAFISLASVMHDVAPRGRLFSLGMTDIEKACASFIKAIAHEPQGAAADLAREMAAGTARFASDVAQDKADKRQP